MIHRSHSAPPTCLSAFALRVVVSYHSEMKLFQSAVCSVAWSYTVRLSNIQMH